MVHSVVRQFSNSNEELEHMDLSSTAVHNSIWWHMRCRGWGLVCLQWVAEGEGEGVGMGGGIFNPVCAHTQKRRGRMCQQVLARAAQEA